MRASVLIFLFLICLSQAGVGQGRTNVTMRVSATIISGATLESVESITVKLNTNTEAIGRFEFVTNKYAVTHVETSRMIQLVNQYGDKIELTTDSLHESSNGKHSVNIEASVNPASLNNLKGTYTGAITTTLHYL